MIDQTVLHAAVQWAADRFEERTISVANGTGRIDEILPAFRVSASEVRTQFPEFSADIDYRIAWQQPFEDELRRRGLLRVLKGKMTASDWLARYSTKGTP